MHKKKKEKNIHFAKLGLFCFDVGFFLVYNFFREGE